MDEEVNEQSKIAELERNKRIEAARTLNHSESDLAKAKKDLKEATRARDSAEAGLTLGGLNPEIPQVVPQSIVNAQISGAEEPFPLLMSPKVPRLILFSLPRKGMSLRTPKLTLLSLPKKWPKCNRRSRNLGQLLYLFLV